jgi:hypothetical protein
MTLTLTTTAVSDPFDDIVRGMVGLEASFELALQDAAEEVEDILRDKTEALGAVATRAFYDGWGVSPTGLSLSITNSAPHAAYSEYGRRPGKPPPLWAIQEWIDAKGLALPRSAAWPIAMHIADSGTEGAHTLDKSAVEVNRVVRKACFVAMRKAFR